MYTFSLLFSGYIVDTLSPLLSGAILKSECAVACVNDANCSSFFYDVSTQACYLKKYVFVSRDRLKNRTDVEYYSLLNNACPASYVYCRFTNQCLRRYESSSMEFPDAKVLCMDNSGHLAFIRSKEANIQAAFVANYETVWIGLERNDTDDEWRWTNGESLGPYINWNDPTRNGVNKIYGKMYRNSKWSAYSERGKLRALCEIDL